MSAATTSTPSWLAARHRLRRAPPRARRRAGARGIPAHRARALAGGGARRHRREADAAPRACRRSSTRHSPTSCPRARASTSSTARTTRSSTSARRRTSRARVPAHFADPRAQARAATHTARAAHRVDRDGGRVRRARDRGAPHQGEATACSTAGSAGRRRCGPSRSREDSAMPLATIAMLDALDDPGASYGMFRRRGDAERALDGTRCASTSSARSGSGLEKAEGSCIGFQLGRCRGVCVGQGIAGAACGARAARALGAQAPRMAVRRPDRHPRARLARRGGDASSSTAGAMPMSRLIPTSTASSPDSSTGRSAAPSS